MIWTEALRSATAIARARKVTGEDGRPALLEFLTAAETEVSHG